MWVLGGSVSPIAVFVEAFGQVEGGSGEGLGFLKPLWVIFGDFDDFWSGEGPEGSGEMTEGPCRRQLRACQGLGRGQPLWRSWEGPSAP